MEIRKGLASTPVLPMPMKSPAGSTLKWETFGGDHRVQQIRGA